MKNKTIFLVFNDLGLGGVQTKLIDLFNAIEQTRKLFIPVLLLREKADFSRQNQLLMKRGIISYRKTYFNNRIRILFPLHLFIQSLRYRPHSILTSLHLESIFTVFVDRIMLMRKTPIIINQDNLLSADIKKKWIKPIITFFYNLANTVIVQTSQAKIDLINNFLIEEKKIVVVPNWTLKTNLVRKKKKIDVIYAGRFDRQKNLGELIEVFSLVVKQLPQAQLLMVGKGGEEMKLHTLIAAKDLKKNIQIVPPVKDISSLLAQSRIFALTSLYEGHPIALVEAMVQGVVPVLLEYPGCSEYIQHLQTGFIEKKRIDMAKRLIHLLKKQNELTKVGRNARRFALKNYTTQPIQTYLSLLGISV